jgi:ABC-type antimicrobial peptide transport system permease subunit
VLRTIGLAVAGLLAGVLISSGLAHSVSGLLFGVTSGDPLTFVAAALVLMTIAVLAGYLPARRASRIDPMICLRAD